MAKSNASIVFARRANQLQLLLKEAVREGHKARIHARQVIEKAEKTQERVNEKYRSFLSDLRAGHISSGNCFLDHALSNMGNLRVAKRNADVLAALDRDLRTHAGELVMLIQTYVPGSRPCDIVIGLICGGLVLGANSQMYNRSCRIDVGNRFFYVGRDSDLKPQEEHY